MTREVQEQEREPWLNAAPVSGVLLPILLIAAFALQFAAPFLTGWPPDRVVWELGLSAAALHQGRWWTLLSHIFVHAGLAHIFMNTSVAFGVATPVARSIGGGLSGLVRFFAFF